MASKSGSGHVVSPALKWIQLAPLYQLGKRSHEKRRRGPSQASLWCNRDPRCVFSEDDNCYQHKHNRLKVLKKKGKERISI